MNRVVYSYIVAFVLCCEHGMAQLHLVTGSPWKDGTASYPSVLLRLDDKGILTPLSELVSSGVGTEWIGASYDWRKLVLLSRDLTAIVVDFDAAAKVKACKLPDSQGRALMQSWLAAAQGGPSFEWLETGADVIKDALVIGMLLDPKASCDESFLKLGPESIRDGVAHGSPGIADLVNQDGFVTEFSADAPGAVMAFTNKPVQLGYEVPDNLRRGMKSLSLMEVNDAKTVVLTMFQAGKGYRTVVFRKTDRTWHTLRNVSEEHPKIRGFGKYIALTEVRAKTPRNPVSAGMDNWIPGEDRLRPDLRERISSLDSHHPVVYPGILHIYNIDSGQIVSFSTNQGDSEVLLVEDDVVYYRAADQLFSVPILRDRVGTSRLLATDDAIRDAHWAFIRR
jgi:hypothetical protein